MRQAITPGRVTSNLNNASNLDISFFGKWWHICPLGYMFAKCTKPLIDTRKPKISRLKVTQGKYKGICMPRKYQCLLYVSIVKNTKTNLAPSNLVHQNKITVLASEEAEVHIKHCLNYAR